MFSNLGKNGSVTFQLIDYFLRKFSPVLALFSPQLLHQYELGFWSIVHVFINKGYTININLTISNWLANVIVNWQVNHIYCYTVVSGWIVCHNIYFYLKLNIREKLCLKWDSYNLCNVNFDPCDPSFHRWCFHIFMDILIGLSYLRIPYFTWLKIVPSWITLFKCKCFQKNIIFKCNEKV